MAKTIRRQALDVMLEKIREIPELRSTVLPSRSVFKFAGEKDWGLFYRMSSYAPDIAQNKIDDESVGVALALAYYGTGDDPEELCETMLGHLEAKILEDNTLGGIAMRVSILGWQVAAEEQQPDSVHTAAMQVQLRIRRREGDPFKR